jgi:hypothetical protein
MRGCKPSPSHEAPALAFALVVALAFFNHPTTPGCPILRSLIANRGGEGLGVNRPPATEPSHCFLVVILRRRRRICCCLCFSAFAIRAAFRPLLDHRKGTRSRVPQKAAPQSGHRSAEDGSPTNAFARRGWRWMECKPSPSHEAFAFGIERGFSPASRPAAKRPPLCRRRERSD